MTEPTHFARSTVNVEAPGEHLLSVDDVAINADEGLYCFFQRSISRETAHNFRNYPSSVFCDSRNHYQPRKKPGAKAAGKESSVSAVG